MNQIHKQDQTDAESGIGLCRRLAQGLDEEIKALAAFDAQRRCFFAQGRWKSSKGAGHLYVFDLQEALREASDSRLTLRFADQEFSGTLVSSQGLQAHLVFDQYLGEHLPHCQIILDRGVLFRALRERFRHLENAPQPGALDLANNLFLPLGQGTPTKRHFVWGPPGTGKTHALAQTALACLRNQERVLLVAHTHRAVNVALSRLAQIQSAAAKPTDDAIAAFKILRLGFHPPPRGASEMFQSFDGDLEAFLPEQYVRHHDPGMHQKKVASHLALKQALDQLQEWQRNHRAQGEHVNAMRHDILLLEKSIKNFVAAEKKMVRDLIPNLHLLACTMTQLFLNDDLAAGGFDTLIVDEASQINLPVLFYAATLVKKKVIVVGDFRQMPPIALARTPMAQVMAMDIFSEVGFEGQDAARLEHFSEVTLLRHQRRMRPEISRLISDTFYQGWLENDASILEREAQAKGPALYFVDTPSALAFSTKKGRESGGSRINLTHAVLAVRCAEQFLQEKMSQEMKAQQKIAIITPYREQVKLLDHMLEDRGLKRFVDVATIHQFQGEERDVVIFDTVESPGAAPSPLMDGPLGSAAARSINVAFSRARQRLVVLANREYLQEALGPKAVLRTVINFLHRHAASPFPEGSNGLEVEASSQLCEDLQHAKNSVVFLLPLLFGKIPEAIETALRAAIDKGVALFFDTLGPKLQRVYLKENFHGPVDFCFHPQVRVLSHDFPDWRLTLNQNLLMIDDTVAWFSAENIFSAKTLVKISGKKTIAGLHEFFGFSMLQQAPALLARCPLCEGKMITMWNRRKYESQGDFYAGCGEGCGYNRPLLKSEHPSVLSQHVKFPNPARANVQRSFPGFLTALPKKEKLVLAISGKQDLEKQCPQCGQRRQIRFKPGQYLFLGCSGYPQCDFRSGYQEPCAKCAQHMVVRRSQNGIFLGCTGFPNCKNTQTLTDDKVKWIVEKDAMV